MVGWGWGGMGALSGPSAALRGCAVVDSFRSRDLAICQRVIQVSINPWPRPRQGPATPSRHPVSFVTFQNVALIGPGDLPTSDLANSRTERRGDPLPTAPPQRLVPHHGQSTAP